MSDDLSVAELTGLRLDEAGAARLLRGFRTLAEAVVTFPAAELKAVEPPLRSTPLPPSQKAQAPL